MSRISDIAAFAGAVEGSGPALEYEERLQQFARSSYTQCCEWFGIPPDAEWPFKLVKWHSSMSSKDPVARVYLLFISEDDGLEAACRSVGHEMYHRVTSSMRGLRQSLWVDEMLACGVAMRLLRQQSMSRYAAAYEDACVACEPLDVMNLRKLGRARRYMMQIAGSLARYPKGFGRDMVRLGNAISGVCGWETFLGLAAAETLSAWVTGLPEYQRPMVKAILGIDVPRSDARSGAAALVPKHLRDFGRALYWLGRHNEAIDELFESRAAWPWDHLTHLYLGEALWQAGRHHEAVSAIRDALKIAPTIAELHFTAGVYSREIGELRAAADHFRSAVLYEATNWDAYHYWALTLYEEGNASDANEVLELLLKSNEQNIDDETSTLLGIVRSALSGN